MPTLSQQLENLQAKIRKYGPDAHCQPLVVLEEVAKENIANKPDAAGRQKTKIAFETFSPKSYSDWCEAKERILPRCGFNGAILADLLLLFIYEAERNVIEDEDHEGNIRERDGIDLALDGLFRAMRASGRDYELELRSAKLARKRKTSPKTAEQDERTTMAEQGLRGALQPSSGASPLKICEDDPNEIWNEEKESENDLA